MAATKKATSSKKATSKSKLETVDTTAVEIPVDEVKKEPKIEETTNLDPDVELFNNIFSERLNHSDILSDTEKEVAMNIFKDAKKSLGEAFSEENASIIAAAATDAVVLSIASINKDKQHSLSVKALIEELGLDERKAERYVSRDERRAQRLNRKEERRQHLLDRKEEKCKLREERKQRLY